MPTRLHGLVGIAVLGLLTFAIRWFFSLDNCVVDPVEWERVYFGYFGHQYELPAQALAHLQEDKDSLRHMVLSFQLQLSTRPGARTLAEGYWECKSSFLHLLAGYLHSTCQGGSCYRIAAVRGVYRTLVLAWQLHQDGEPLAADTALLMAAAQLGLHWQTFDPVPFPTRVLPTNPDLPACAHAWSVLRYMWAGEEELPSTLYPWHAEAGGLALGWRELMARALNYSLEAEAGRLGGQVEVVSAPDGRQLLLVSCCV
jgi:hypothetical protein